MYLLEDKGDLSEDLRTSIMSQKDSNILQKWLLAAAKAGTIEDFEMVIG